MQCRIDLIVTYKQFVLFKFKFNLFNLLSNETQFYSQVEKSWFQTCCQQSSLKKPLVRWYSIIILFQFKSPVQCFSRQVVMNKCFALNSKRKKEKKDGANSCCRFREKRKNASI